VRTRLQCGENSRLGREPWSKPTGYLRRISSCLPVVIARDQIPGTVMELKRGIGQRAGNPKCGERWAERPDQHRLLFCSGQNESSDQYAGACVDLGPRGNVRDCGWVDCKLP